MSFCRIREGRSDIRRFGLQVGSSIWRLVGAERDEYRIIWRHFRSSAPRTSCPGKGGDGEVQTASSSFRGGKCASPQAKAAAYSLYPPVCHGNSGYVVRQSVC